MPVVTVVALPNLPERALADKIPAGILSEDQRGLIRAVIDGLQDRQADLRALANQLGQIWDVTAGIGLPAPVVELTYRLEDDRAQTTTLDVKPGTPSDSTALLRWAELEAGLPVGTGLTAIRATSSLRTADSDLLDLLAATVGARLDTIDGSTDAEQLAGFQRVLLGYFGRLKLKGTAQSFELTGRLLGFADVKFTPLWCRLSARQPGAIGSSVNDPDFAAQPEVLVTPGQPSETYRPDVLDDGEAYIWESGPLSADPTVSAYLPLAVNGLNPYIAVKVTGPVELPAAGLYTLGGGGQLTKARSTGTVGFYFEALAPGSSFNGARIEVRTQSGTTTIRVVHSLSALKFRSSYFELAAGFNLEEFKRRRHLVPVRPCTDLQSTPELYQGDADFAAGVGGQVGVAYEHARPWGGPTPREQVPAGTAVIDVDYLQAAAKKLSSAIETVRPLTRFARTIRCGLSFSHQTQYAHVTGATKLVNNSGANGTIVGSLTAEDERPSGLFSGQFELVGGGSAIPITAETDPTNDTVVNLRASRGGFSLTGSVNYSNGSYAVTISGNPGQLTLTGRWTAASSDLVRPTAGMTEPFSYQSRPEDALDLTYWQTLESTYPWRRGLEAGGERVGEVDLDANSAVVAHQVLLAEDQTPTEVVAVETTGHRPYHLTKVSALPSRLCLGYKGSPVEEAAGEWPLPSVDNPEVNRPFGEPYEIGLVRGHLVATPAAHWQPAQRAGLVLWLRLAEHPKQPYVAVDSSDYRLTPAELEQGRYFGSYLLSDRQLDDSFGGALRLQAGRKLTIAKDRPLALDFTLTAWLKSESASGAESTVLELGPIRWTLTDGNGLRTRYHNGAWQALGSSHALSAGFNFVAVTGQSIQPTALVEVEVGSTVQTTKSNLGVVGGVQLLAGQLVLLAGQSTAAENGLWVAQLGSWTRATLPPSFDPQAVGSYFKVLAGAAAGLWRLTTSGSIVYGTTSLAFSKVNCRLTTRRGSLTEPVAVLEEADIWLTPFNQLPQVLTLTGPAWATYWTNLRVWKTAKTAVELNLIRLPAFSSLPVSGRPSWATSARGDRYQFEVLASGYARLSLANRPAGGELERRATRATGAGFNTDNAYRQVAGFGERRAPEGVNALGTITTTPANGQAVSGTSTDYDGLTPSHQFTHPVDRRLYVRADGGYLVELTALRQPDGTFTLAAKRTPTAATLNLQLGLAADLPEAQLALQGHFYLATDTDVVYRCSGASWSPSGLTRTQVESLRYTQDLGGPSHPPSTTAAVLGAKSEANGELRAYCRAATGLPSTRPGYLYCEADRRLHLPFDVGTNLSLWDSAADGLDPESPFLGAIGLPGRETAGSLTFKGAGTLPAGRYRLTLDVTNWGQLDAGFSGYALEAAIGQNAATEFRALTAGQPQFSLLYAGSALTGYLPGNASPAELQQILGPSFEVLTGGSYQSRRGGPFYLKFTDTGAKGLIQAQIKTCTAVVTRLVLGNSATFEIQKIEFTRPTVEAELTVAEPVSPELDGYWRLKLYWRNDLPQPGESLDRVVSGNALLEAMQRTLVIHRATLELRQVAVVAVQLGSVGAAPSLTAVNIASQQLSQPGGWRAALTAAGLRTLTHEALIYTDGSSSPADGGPSLPAASLLTGSSADRLDSVIAHGAATALANVLTVPSAPDGNLEIA